MYHPAQAFVGRLINLNRRATLAEELRNLGIDPMHIRFEIMRLRSTAALN